MSNNIPGPSMGLNEIVDAFTQKLIEDRAATPSRYNPLRPSSAGKCERELGYEYMQFKGHAKYPSELNSPSVHRLLNLGESIEYHANGELYQAFRQSTKPIYIKYKQQTVSLFKLHDGSLIEGKIDLWLETEDWRCLADWKSKGDKYSQFYKSSWDEFVEKLVKTGHANKFGNDAVYITDLDKFLQTNKDAFFNNNLYQLNTYACSDFAQERNVTFCSILQYNKNDSRIREVRFVPSKTVYEAVKTKMQKVAVEVDTNKTVDNLNKDYMLGSQKCGFCSFRATCWPEDDALKTYFRELPPKQWAKDLDRLPKGVQDELTPLFNKYKELESAPDQLEKVEEDIVKVLDRAKVYKVRLDQGKDSERVYRVRDLKSGGIGGGPRRVLRRDKN